MQAITTVSVLALSVALIWGEKPTTLKLWSLMVNDVESSDNEGSSVSVNRSSLIVALLESEKAFAKSWGERVKEDAMEMWCEDVLMNQGLAKAIIESERQ
ncbi:hypothetical protein Ancab_029041 [Ancistrocladus abbreviatus]